MPERYRFGQFELQPTQRQLRAGSVEIPLGSRAFDLLLCLVERRERLVTKAEILDRVWPGLVVEENNLSVHVSALRKILGHQSIATVAGRGYRFALPTTTLDGDGPVAPSADESIGDEAPSAPAIEAPASRSADGIDPVTTESPAIAVLPFGVRAESRNLELLAEGLAEDVTALLARMPGFLVISRASSFLFRSGGAGLDDVGRQLHVRYLVEGSLRPVADRLRVSVRLVEAQTGRVHWASSFESTQEGATDLQDDIVRGIVSELQPELTRAEIALIRRQRPGNIDAWGHYRQAIGALSFQGWNERAVREALSELRSAIGADPAFGLAYAYFAVLTGLAGSTGLLGDLSRFEDESITAAERAIALDEGSAEVLGYAGCALCDCRRHDRGEEVLRQAVAIDPSNAQAHVALGAALAMRGDLEAGIASMRFGMRISPRDRRLAFWGWSLGCFLVRRGDTAQALEEARLANLRDPRFYLSRVLEAAMLDRLGRSDDAREALQAARRLRPSLSIEEISRTHGEKAATALSRQWH